MHSGYRENNDLSFPHHCAWQACFRNRCLPFLLAVWPLWFLSPWQGQALNIRIMLKERRIFSKKKNFWNYQGYAKGGLLFLFEKSNLNLKPKWFKSLSASEFWPDTSFLPAVAVFATIYVESVSAVRLSGKNYHYLPFVTDYSTVYWKMELIWSAMVIKQKPSEPSFSNFFCKKSFFWGVAHWKTASWLIIHSQLEPSLSDKIHVFLAGNLCVKRLTWKTMCRSPVIEVLGQVTTGLFHPLFSTLRHTGQKRSQSQAEISVIYNLQLVGQSQTALGYKV